MKKTITVIGGSGFIGTRLCSRLVKDEKLNLRIFDKKISPIFPNKTIIGDIRDLKALSSAVEGSYALINLAAEHRDDVYPRSLYDEVNVIGAENCCKVSDLNGINRIIFTSSVAVYGFATPNAGEHSPIAPFNDYGRTKYEAEKIFLKWKSDREDKFLCIVRPTVVFGENNRGNVFNLFNQIAKRRFVMVASGNNIKSMAYVENVAAFLERCIYLQQGIHLYNYVDKPDFKTEELILLVKSILELPPHHIRIPYELALIFGYAADFVSKISGLKLPVSSIRIRKFNSETSFSTLIDDKIFKAEVSLQEGIERTLRHEFRRTTEN